MDKLLWILAPDSFLSRIQKYKVYREGKKVRGMEPSENRSRSLMILEVDMAISGYLTSQGGCFAGILRRLEKSNPCVFLEGGY